MNSADKRLVTCVRVLTGLFVGAFAGFTAGTLLAIIVAEELEFPWLRQLIYGFRCALIGGWIGILVGWGRLQLRAVATPWGQKEPGPAPPSRRARQPEPVEVEPQEDRGHDTRHGGEARQSEPVKGLLRKVYQWLVAVRPVLTGLFVGAFAGFTAGVLLAIIVAPEQLFYGFHGALIGGWGFHGALIGGCIGILVGGGRLLGGVFS